MLPYIVRFLVVQVKRIVQQVYIPLDLVFKDVGGGCVDIAGMHSFLQLHLRTYVAINILQMIGVWGIDDGTHVEKDRQISNFGKEGILA